LGTVGFIDDDGVEAVGKFAAVPGHECLRYAPLSILRKRRPATDSSISLR
jgi:hypothetical protein